jgi:hypothetical protein
MFEAGVIIGRLRVRGAGLDPLLARLRAAHLLDGVELRPARLPPAAIFCVRALRDPLPRAVRLDQPQPSPPQAWRAALSAQLDDLAGRAARPWAGPVPATAAAVIFADRAELLACLAVDWRRAQVLNRWWWRELVRNTDIRQAVVGAWLASAEFVPDALARLTARGEAHPFLAALTDDDTDRLTQEVFRRFGLRGVQQTLVALAGATADPAAGQVSEGEWGGGAATPRQIRPPWHGLLTVGSTLSPARELLLGVSVSLARRPGATRTADFAGRVGGWVRAALAAAEAPDHAQPAAAWTRTTNAASTPARSGETTPRPMSAPPGDRGVPGAAAPEAAGAADGSVQVADDDRRADAGATVPPKGAAVSPERRANHAPLMPGAELPSPLTPAEVDAGADVAALPVVSEVPAEVETRLGGLFYLVNVALSLGLYGDFTQPETSADALPLWDWLALMGEALLGDGLRGDPVWDLLGQLAGRADAEPGAGFAPPDKWLAPDEWAVIFGPAVCRWAVEDERLRAWHPAGFWLWDVPSSTSEISEGMLSGGRRGGPAAVEARLSALRLRAAALLVAPAVSSAATRMGRGRARTSVDDVSSPRSSAFIRALSMDPGFTLSAGDVPQPLAGALARWVDWWAAYLRARLVDALGLDGPDALPAALFGYHARIFASAARLDVMLRLDEVSLPVRYAGLDRNPGWVPAAGRTIAFHFE